MFSRPQTGNRAFRTEVWILGGLLMIAMIVGFIRHARDGHETGYVSSNPIKTDGLVQPAKPETARPPAKAVAIKPPVEAWATKDSRDILGGFFIKPYLRQWLKDPDSLQDFEVVSARPDKKLQGSFKVTVFYRARNSFGALIPEQRTVTMVYNPNDDNHPWVMMP